MTRRQLPPPRWQTPLPPGVVGSWGPHVGEYAQRTLGVRLDRWQQRALNRALAVGEDGRLVHRLYLISTARQQGKTVLVRSLIGWALTAPNIPDWHSILGLAHDRKQARIPYEAVLRDLAPVRKRLGAAAADLRLTRYLGIRSDLYGWHREYHTASREARDAVRGESNDAVVFDEVRTQRDMDTWAAVEPTITARPDPLVTAISSAGNDRSVLLRAWWEQGRRIIDGAEPFSGFGMTWYAAPDDVAEDDPRALLAANPALAEGRISLAGILGTGTIRPGSALWRQERLNLWTDAADEWLPPGVWEARAAPQPGDWSRVILGVEATPSWRRVSVTVALVTDAGAWVGVAAELDTSRMAASTVSPAELVDLLGRTAATWQPSVVAYSAAAAAAPHVEAWATAAGVAVAALGPRQIRAASELFRSELIGGRLSHMADPLLTAQVRASRPSGPLEAGGWYLSIRDSVGDVDAVRAAAWAHWAAISPEAPKLIAQVFV